MTLNIQNTSIINANGTKTNRNCKAVFCITTNTFYVSVAETAKAIGVTQGAISWVLTKRMKTVKGLRFCYVHEIMEYIDEIAETNRINAEKARLYDELIAKQNKAKKIEAKRDKHNARLEKLMQAFIVEYELRAKAIKELDELESEN